MFRWRGTRKLSQITHKSLHLLPAITQKHNPVLFKLMKEFTEVSYVAAVVNKEDVKDIEYNEWKNRITLLKQYGFHDSDCFKMISAYPSLLKIPQTHLKSTIQQWVNAELGTKNFQLLLLSHPHLLEINDSVIRKRLPILRTYFRGVSAVSQLIMNSPNVMYDDWNQLSSKINYLINERNFKIGDVLKSCALAKDLDFIKLRFYVAEKCGVYKQYYLMPHQESKHRKDNGNPKLKYVIQDNDENFAKLVAKITLEEYNAAKDLFNDENNSLHEEDDYSDND